MNVRQMRNEALGKRVVKALESRNMEAYYAADKEEAVKKALELIRERRIAPELVIGVPVGFVNVVQSKEQILTLKDTPYIVARGRKGGSNIAACICNALLYQCKKD